MQTRYKPYRLVPFSRVILYKLYICHLDNDHKSEFSVADVAQAFSVPVSRNLVSSALDFLRNKNYNEGPLVTRHRKPGADVYVFRIAPEGFRAVEEALRNKSSDIAYLHENGDEVLDEIAGIDSLFLSREDLLDHDPWSPLPIDREDPSYTEAATEVEAAIEVIRADNGFAASHPEQREGILATLEEGLAWLKDRAPTRAQIFSLLISPLQWVSTNFSKAVIGEAAKKAAQKVVDLLNSFF
jgi:hypothetical protein